MKAKNFLRSSVMAGCMLVLGAGHAQVTTANNQPNGAGNFVGWDNSVINEPLMIRHDANQPIEWYTDAIKRMLLTPTVTSYSFNARTHAVILHRSFPCMKKPPVLGTPKACVAHVPPNRKVR